MEIEVASTTHLEYIVFMTIYLPGHPRPMTSSDLRAVSLFVGVGLTGLWAASSGLDQTVGSVGLFESLSFAAGSLGGVGWWGVPWFEMVCLIVAVGVIAHSVARLIGRRRTKVAEASMSAARLFCWFGSWVFAMSLVASMRSGQGLPPLTAWSSSTSLLTFGVAVILVDLGYYVEHRLRHSWQRSNPGSPATSSTEVWRIMVEVLGSVTTALVLSLVGFELLVIAAARLLIEIYRIGVRGGCVPAGAGFLLMTSNDARVHDATTRPRAVGLGGVLSVWDRLGRTRPRSVAVSDGALTELSELDEVTSA